MWLADILKRLRGEKRPPPPSAQALQKMLRQIERTQEVEYSCDQVFDWLDQFAEAVAQGKRCR